MSDLFVISGFSLEFVNRYFLCFSVLHYGCGNSGVRHIVAYFQAIVADGKQQPYTAFRLLQ